MTKWTPQDDEVEVTPLNLYSGEQQHNTFPHLTSMFPTSELTPASSPHRFPNGATIDLPETFDFDGSRRSVASFLESTDTSALLVLKNGEVCFEGYWSTGGPEVQWISWSVAKSFVSALIGIALDEGLIASIDDSISSYVPELVGSAYDGVPIRAILQMSSGARWNEDYSDPSSDVNRFGVAIAGGGSLLEFVAGMVSDRQPGTLCQYNSADTQVLGHLLIAATGRSLTEYMQEKLYEPLGMESRGDWLLDCDGVEMAFGGLNLTARDFAKLGELYRLGGICKGKQVVPEEWVRSSVTSEAPHLANGQVIVGGHVFPFGYGYQWWLPSTDRGEFAAIGVYNQFIYVDPTRDVTVVKLSANRRYGLSTDEADNREAETVSFIRALTAKAAGSKL